MVVLTGSERNTGGFFFFFLLSAHSICVFSNTTLTLQFISGPLPLDLLSTVHHSVRVLQYGYSDTECHEKKEKRFVFLCSCRILMFLLYVAVNIRPCRTTWLHSFPRILSVQ